MYDALKYDQIILHAHLYSMDFFIFAMPDT